MEAYQLIVNFLQVIGEGISSLTAFLKDEISHFVYLGDWLKTASSVVSNIVVWMPLPARSTLFGIIGTFIVLRIVGRD